MASDSEDTHDLVPHLYLNYVGLTLILAQPQATLWLPPLAPSGQPLLSLPRWYQQPLSPLSFPILLLLLPVPFFISFSMVFGPIGTQHILYLLLFEWLFYKGSVFCTLCVLFSCYRQEELVQKDEQKRRSQRPCCKQHLAGPVEQITGKVEYAAVAVYLKFKVEVRLEIGGSNCTRSWRDMLEKIEVPILAKASFYAGQGSSAKAVE
ncbi:hypothetical protein K435DRAFT_793235 [Dendrothele bispora CBS 962.96]|uniref:Uncharacterized protein n=1 Tax=Dendrothele bispora (strain CBS 962.96) TaxID=1314807 RepID=A0A4S8MH82_DENBC|nr:hypothetical protein K435DRAFT_793235 [Dendrothele bispora CBS 962.96]